MGKRNFGSIKSLVHFDFPYFNEPNDGLDDDVGLETWSRNGNVKLAGTQIPYEYNASPKFGYRCAYFPDTSSFISTANANGTFNLSPSGSYEIEFFAKFNDITESVLTQQGYRFFGGHTFKCFDTASTINKETVNWADAEAACEALGGHLPTSTSAEKNTFLNSLADMVLSYAIFDNETSSWYWGTGEEWNYTNWLNTSTHQISGTDGGDLFIVKEWSNETVNGQWVNMTPHNQWCAYYFICEWDYDMREDKIITEGDIFNIGDDIKLSIEEKLSTEPSAKLSLNSATWDISKTANAQITIGTWQHILLRIANKHVKVYLDSSLIIDEPILGKTNISPSIVKLGGYLGYMDEFVFRHNAGAYAPKVPTHPYSGWFDISKAGGYGTGADGDVTISTNTRINSYGVISSITDAKTFTVSNLDNSSITADAGREVMIHITAPRSTASAAYPLVGLYAFAKIESVSGTNVVLNKEITTENGFDFTLDSSILNTYYVQAIIVPNYNSLIINSGVTVSPLSWNTTKGGGIVAFRCKVDCTVNGSIITHSYGAVRYDLHQITNSKLIDRFLCSHGGGIFIACGGTFTAPAAARLGATWSGAGDGSNGAAGYGGKGWGSSGGAGGVGGGGGGKSYSRGGNCGSKGTNSSNASAGGAGGGGCGGNGGNGTNSSYGAGGGGGGGQGGSGGAGGTGTKAAGNAGTINGGNYTYSDITRPSGAGGGGAGGNGGTGRYYSSSASGDLAGGVAGASVILIAKKLNIHSNAVSTGGGAVTSGSGTRVGGAGGGGTGFCYIACGEQVSE